MFAVENEELWRAEKKHLQIGKGSKGTLRGHGVREGNLKRLKCGQGVRMGGGGRKPFFADLYPGVKRFFEGERAGGHYIDSEDLTFEFQSMLELTQVRLRAQEAADGLSSVEKTLLDRTTQTLSTIWEGVVNGGIGGTG